MSLLQSLLTYNKYSFDHVKCRHATDAGHEPEFNCLKELKRKSFVNVIVRVKE